VRASRMAAADRVLLIAMGLTLIAGLGLRLAGLGGVAEGMLVGRGQ
jgi:hypothetical protein